MMTPEDRGVVVASDRVKSAHGQTGTAPRPIDLAHHEAIHLSPLMVDPPARRVRHDDGREVLLEPRMMQVLIALAEASGSIVSRDDLIACCWDGRFVGDEAISSVIYRLRKTLKELTGDGIQIETTAKVGFRLLHQGAKADRKSPSTVALRVRMVAIGVAFLGLLGFGLVRGGFVSVPFAAQASSPPSIAVLPFDDISPGHQDAYFARGMAEQIMSQLSVEPGLRVIGKTSAAMIDRDHGIDDARARLGVTHVLEGSVRRNGQALRVDVRLIDTRNGRQLWSEQFDRTLGDVFAIQDDIGLQVLSRLRGTFSAKRMTRAISTTPQVYDLYLTALALERQATEAAYLKERALLNKAIQLDPNYAPAYVRLSLLPPASPMPTREANAIQLRLVRRALELAPDLSAAHAAMGFALYNDRDWTRSLPYLNKAVSLDPGNDLAWWILGVLQFQHLCRPREAVASLRRGIAIEPLTPDGYGTLTWDLGELGDFAGAERVIGQYAAVSQNPALVHSLRAMLAYENGQIARGLSESQQAYHLQPKDHWFWMMQGFDALGMRKQALAIIPKDRLEALPPGLSIGHPRAAAWAMKLGNDLWASTWGNLDVGSAALIRGGRSDWLVKSFDRNYASVDAFAQALGCKQLPAMAPNVILALRQQGRKRDADRLLELAWARYLEARKAGYETGWDPVGAELLILAGRRDPALQLLNHALGPSSDRWLWVKLEYPVYDAVRDDPRFRAVVQQTQALIAKQRNEFAQQGNSISAS